MVATASYTIPDMAQTDKANAARRATGDAVRARILAELRRRRAAGEPSPTVTILSRMLGCHRQTAAYHVALLVDAGLLEWYEPAEGIHVLRLTDHT